MGPATVAKGKGVALGVLEGAVVAEAAAAAEVCRLDATTALGRAT